MQTIRERLEAQEASFLSAYGAKSTNAKRAIPEEKSPMRTEYQRDRDRIIHSPSFRRLKHKTQVFLSPEGDHYRTRLTHTLEVSQISRTVARALMLNEDLAEAIALGHDLGHTPFGHAGERALNNIYKGGFKHYEQSVRVCEKIERHCEGLNLTADTLNGILCHTTGKEANTLEGRIVKFCDQIAYINHDIDDAIRAGIIAGSDIPSVAVKQFGKTKSDRINSMVISLINNSSDNIVMAQEDLKVFLILKDYLFKEVYLNPKAKAEEDKVEAFLDNLYCHLIKNPDLLTAEYKIIMEQEGVERAAVDYIAGMTDTYAIEFYKNAFIPKSWDR